MWVNTNNKGLDIVDTFGDWGCVGRGRVYFNMDNGVAMVDRCRVLVDRKSAVVGILGGARAEDGSWHRRGLVIH